MRVIIALNSSYRKIGPWIFGKGTMITMEIFGWQMGNDQSLRIDRDSLEQAFP